MKKYTKHIVAVLLLALVLCMVPAMEEPAAAATTPYVSFTNLSSQNPIMDMHLPFDTFKSGGPFTLTMEVKVENIAGWMNPTTGATEQTPNVTTYVEGTVYGTLNKQSDEVSKASSGNYAKQGNGWQSKKFTFQNVGTINVSGNDIAGNLLRTYFWQTTGTVYIRNVVIKNNAGSVVYNMNSDPDLLGLMSQMQSSGMTESDISNVASINEKCLWCAPGSFGIAGDHYGSVHIDNGTSTNTTTTTNRIPGNATTTQAPVQTTTNAPVQTTTKNPVQTTTKNPAQNNTTQRPATQNTTASTQAIMQNPCANGHSYVIGYCTVCGMADPNYVPTTTPTVQPTTQAPTQSSNGGGMTINPIALVAFVLILLAGQSVIILFATGAVGKKKKKKK